MKKSILSMVQSQRGVGNIVLLFAAILLFAVVLISIINFSNRAEGANKIVSTEQEVTAPINKTRHYGNMNGVKIAIPPKYWASVVVQNDIHSDLCKDTSSSDQFNCPISSISLNLRYPNFEPIYTRQDLTDWGGNFMKPFDKQSPDHQWITMGYKGDLFESTKGNLGALYRSHVDEATKHFGELSCNSKYELEHCATEKQDGPLLANEFYFDTKAGQTLIECTRLAPTNYGKYLGCHLYFLIPEIKAVAEIGSDSDQENLKWDLLKKSVNDIAISFIAK